MSAAKQKGTRFESSLLPLHRQYWPEASRSPLAGAADVGDLILPGNRLFITQMKNRVKMNMKEWHGQAQAQALRAGVSYGLVIHKRMGVTAPESQWATTTVGDLYEMFCAIEHGVPWRPRVRDE
ncbi:hypothetical protein [Streptomyces hydrogenans]|uniref:hypothetical protein n=1 Tax=Streptomyces hydrogenans TaxID=1873719 RepID=UPI0035E21E99